MHLGDRPSQTPVSSALLIRQDLNLSPCSKVKPTLQLNVAFELIFVAAVNLTDPFAGGSKGGQFAVNMQHTN